MEARDVRFMAAVLGDAPDCIGAPAIAIAGHFQGTLLRWPHTGRSATVYRSSMGVNDALFLTRIDGGGLEAPELGVGLDLHLENVDVGNVYGVSPHLLGHLHAPETSRAAAGTVQIAVAESMPADCPSFEIVKLRARLLWQSGGRHVLRFIRQMPVGWPSGDHHEEAEAALTGRMGRCEGNAWLSFGLPYLSPERVLWRSAGVSGLHDVAVVLAFEL